MSSIAGLWPLSALKRFSSAAFAFFFAIRFAAGAAEGIRSVDLPLKSLVYDSFTEKLYGAATNDLLQIDPESGAILKAFRLGTNVSFLSLGAVHGICAAVDDGHAVRRFSLETFTAEDSIRIGAGAIRAQSVSGNGSFGRPITFDVTITNKGPGTAIQIQATNSFSSGAAFLDMIPAPGYRDPIPLQWDIITPAVRPLSRLLFSLRSWDCLQIQSQSWRQIPWRPAVTPQPLP